MNDKIANMRALNDVLVALYTQLDNFTTLKSYIISNHIESGTLFHPTTLTRVSDALSQNPSLVTDALGFLDTANLLSVASGLYPESFKQYMIEIICSSRLVEDNNLVFGRNNVDDYLFSDGASAQRLLRSNHALIAIFAFSMILQILNPNVDG